MTSTSHSLAGNDTASRTPRSRRAGPLAAIVAGMMLAACSTLPDWTRPSTVSDAVSGQSPSETSNEAVAAKQAEAEAASSDANFPSAGTVPQVPATGDAATKRDLADSLVADRQHARYSGEALRGGTEPPASPLPSRRTEPLPELPATTATESASAASSAQAGVIPERSRPAYEAPTRRMGRLHEGEVVDSGMSVAESTPATPAAAPTPAVEVATLPEPTPAPAPVAAAPAPAAVPAPTPAPAAVAAAPAPVATPAPVRQAAAAPTRRPAVPANAVPRFETEEAIAAASQPAAVTPRRVVTPAATGEPQFAASSAPPLPAEVLDQVPAVVAARFDETRGGTSAPTQVTPVAAPAGGSDGVVIDYSAIGAGSPVPDPASFEQGSTPTLPIQSYEPLEFSGAEGGPFAPVAIYFGHGSAKLSAADRSQISEIAALHQKRGTGTVRVVGHASSRTNNLPVDSHLLANFDMSMDRANAVANELMRKGVAASDLVIEAVGDRSPVFYESMPAGEAGNRRAEIFLE